jgi:enoyl-CoA hydratase/carnithine racemase
MSEENSVSEHETNGPPMPKIIAEARGSAGYITFNRPRVLNAIDSEVKTLLVEAIERFEADATIRVLVLTGSDCGSFSTGSDLKSIATNFDRGVDITGMQAKSADYFGALVAARKPVIAAIDGYAVGGGFELALASDIRLATASSRFGLPEPKSGMMGEYGLDHLSRIVPLGEALHMQLTGILLDAERAHQIGLIQQLAADRADLFERVERLVADIERCSPQAVLTIKHVVREGRNLPARYAADFSRPFREMVHNSENAAEGARAFAEKRPPSWAVSVGT